MAANGTGPRASAWGPSGGEPSREEELLALAHAIVWREPARLRALKATARYTFSGGAKRVDPQTYFFPAITHYVYAGDTLLHVAAAAYDLAAAQALLSAGADVRARNRRGAEPLHYAADGVPGSKAWDPGAQAALVSFLISSGADPNAFDKDGVGPLHRAVRTRSTGAVEALLAGGADPARPSRRGSTAMDLATNTTGRGGSGSPEAKREQAAIRRLLGA